MLLLIIGIGLFPHLLKASNVDTIAFIKKIQEIPDGGPTGEGIAWHINYDLGPILDNYRQNQTQWVESTDKILNLIANKMTIGPDGYKGFIGPYIYNPNQYWCDVHVGDAILIEHMLTFAMITQQNAALKEKYRKSIQRFIDIGEKDLIEKWEKRGTFHMDGIFAGYKEWNQYCKPGEIGKWYVCDTMRGENRAAPTLPFNKAMDMADCMLKLYLLTGNNTYKVKAEKIYNRLKAGMNPFMKGYTWNYWEPITPEDIDISTTDNNRILSHWVDTHPYRNYQAGEVEKIIFAYHMGVTFTETDIRRLVHANLQFMWNGTVTTPLWQNSNSKLPGYKKAPDSKTYPTTAGTLWSALSPFDETICLLLAKKGASNCSTDYTRKYAPNAIVKEPWWMKGIKESAGQILAVAIPSEVSAGDSIIILSKALAPVSPVEIIVLPEKGGKAFHLATQQMGMNHQLFYVWDGKINGKCLPGNYVIIWKYRGGERAYPVIIK